MNSVGADMPAFDRLARCPRCAEMTMPSIGAVMTV